MDDEQEKRLRERLLARIRRKYVTVTRTLTFPGLRLDFTRIADPDVVLDQVADEVDRRERKGGPRQVGEELHLPYWAELWDSAAGIVQFLIRNELKQNPHISVLDLGCGMGLTGAAAAALGANVLFADLEPPALLFAALNSLPTRDRVRTRRTNWKTDDLHEQFDLIIGADILYEKAQWEPLSRFWRKHLKSTGRILLGEPGRQSGELFIPWIKQEGWNLTEFEEKVETRDRPIRLFRLTHPA